MNRRQRIAIFIGTLVIAVMLIFPPMRGWHRGYGFVLNRRSTYIAELDRHTAYGNDGWVYWHIDQERLIFQVLIVTILTGGVVVLVGGKRI
jgi:hypothetical protein